MSGSDPLLDRAGLEEALRRLGERLVGHELAIMPDRLHQ